MIALYTQTHKPSGVTLYEVVVLRVAAAHSALRADFGNIRPFFRGQLVVRLMYRCPV
jgi:hypothetical protein